MKTQPIYCDKDGSAYKVMIVAAQFNRQITERLLDGCQKELLARGVLADHISVIWVPGAFELPLIAQEAAKSSYFDAVICLGAVIRGDTYHFELVADNAAFGIQQAALKTSKPIIFGVLSTDTLQQAKIRSNDEDNKGQDAAQAALDMIYSLQSLRQTMDV